jgi:cell division protein FtsW
MLLVVGLVMVLSASSVESYQITGSSFTIFGKQAMWFAIGLPLLWVASRLPARAYRALAYVGLVGVIALLCLVAVAGVEVNGNRNWLRYGGFQLQPSEFAKLVLVIWGADLLARKHKLLDQWKHLLIPLLPVAGLLVALVLVGNDLGTAMILMAIVGALLFFAGAPLRLFVGMGGLLGLMVWALSQAPSQSYRFKRFEAWLHPDRDPLHYGFQVRHAKYALGSGNWFGVGLGGSREKWGSLPEQHNDFIFAIIGEELGLVGTIGVLALFAALGYAGFRVATRTKDPFVRLAASGITTWILFQALVNIGAVMGVLPVVGIPLPLVSYGGSALLPTMLGIGVLLSFARNEPGAREGLRARGPGVVRRSLARVRPRRVR